MITVSYGQDSRRLDYRHTIMTIGDSQGSIVFNYTGEIGSDTLSSVTAETKNMTAGTPSITGNTASISVSGFDSSPSLTVKATTAAGRVIERRVYFNFTDLD